MWRDDKHEVKMGRTNPSSITVEPPASVIVSGIPASIKN